MLIQFKISNCQDLHNCRIIVEMFFATNELVNDEFEFVHHLSQELLIGATESSVYTMEWGIAELTRNPMVMKCAQTELKIVIGTNRIVEEADLQKLTYLQAVVKEIFCLHPPLPLSLPHSSLDEACFSCRMLRYTTTYKSPGESLGNGTRSFNLGKTSGVLS